MIAGGAGAAVCAMLVLGAIGGLAAYEAFVRYAAPARRDVVAPSSASASKDATVRAARRGAVVQPRLSVRSLRFSINAFRSRAPTSNRAAIV